MTDLQLLLAAIIMNPDDDVPRLMYADELFESENRLDRALGKYIKLSIELANHKKPGLRDNIGELYRKGIELNDTVNKLWGNCHLHPSMVNYIGQTANKYSSLEMRLELEVGRGFISSITCTATQFLSICDKLIWHESMEDEIHLDQSGNISPKKAPGSYKYKKETYILVEPRPCPPTAHPVREVKITDSSRVSDSKIFEWEKLAEKYGIEFDISDLP